jgi:AAA domain
MLKLLELQERTGMTIKMLGDREQAQAIEAGDALEILRRALPPEALPELLTTMRQVSKRGRQSAGLFRDGDAAQALAMKREDGHAMLVGGDCDQVVARIAELYLARRDILMACGAKRGITISAPTNDDVAEISQAIRRRFKERGEIGGDEIAYRAIDQDGRTMTCRSPAAIVCACTVAPGAPLAAARSMSGTTAISWRCSAGSLKGYSSERKTGALPTSNGAGSTTVKPAGCCSALAMH